MSTATNFELMRHVFERNLYLADDPDLLAILLASYIANYYQGDPIWLLFIGLAGSGKTELVLSMSEFDKTEVVSDLTPYSLASAKHEEQSLLYRLDGKVMIVPEVSAISNMDKNARGLLFSILRAAFDGTYVRRTTSATIRFGGKFGLFICGTPIFEQMRTMDSQLGERLLNVRSQIVDSAELSERASANADQKEAMRIELKSAMSSFLESIEWDNLILAAPQLDRPVIEHIIDASRILVRLRSTVSRDNLKEIDFPVDVNEVPTRVIGQIRLLGAALKELGYANNDIVRVVNRILRDNIPYPRMRILRAIAGGAKTVAFIVNSARISSSYAYRIIEECKLLELIVDGRHGYEIIDNSTLRDILA